jgi:hypothetical protein
MGKELVYFISNLDYDGMGGHLKKIARVFPWFLHLKILKEPFWAT